MTTTEKVLLGGAGALAAAGLVYLGHTVLEDARQQAALDAANAARAAMRALPAPPAKKGGAGKALEDIFGAVGGVDGIIKLGTTIYNAAK